MDRFCFEKEEFFPARKRVWAWAVECLEGPVKNKKIFCSHLVAEVDPFDLAALFQRVHDFCKVENIQLFSEKMEKFFSARPVYPTETLFQFFERMSTLKKEIDRLEVGGVKGLLSEQLLSWKLFQAIPLYPHLSFYYQNLLLQSTGELMKKSPVEILQETQEVSKMLQTIPRQNRGVS